MQFRKKNLNFLPHFVPCLSRLSSPILYDVPSEYFLLGIMNYAP